MRAAQKAAIRQQIKRNRNVLSNKEQGIILERELETTTLILESIMKSEEDIEIQRRGFGQMNSMTRWTGQ